jgi:hypothetical protein
MKARIKRLLGFSCPDEVMMELLLLRRDTRSLAARKHVEGIIMYAILGRDRASMTMDTVDQVRRDCETLE